MHSCFDKIFFILFQLIGIKIMIHNFEIMNQKATLKIDIVEPAWAVYPGMESAGAPRPPYPYRDV